MSTHKAFDSRLSESHQNGKRPKLLNEKNWNYNEKKIRFKYGKLGEENSI